MEFIFFTPTLNRFEECNALIRSVYAGTKQPKAVIILDNSGGNFTLDEDNNKDNLQVYVAEKNIGVARAFNLALYLGATQYPDDYVIVSNDDLTLYPDTLEGLEKGIEANPDKLIYCSDLQSANSFSFFCLNPLNAVNTVGFFETAYHSYLEDCDWMYRARQLGHELVPIQECRIKDHVGSATLKSFTPEQELEFHERRARGIGIYREKWGAMPEQGEKYTTPFNSGIDSVLWHRQKFNKVHPFQL